MKELNIIITLYLSLIIFFLLIYIPILINKLLTKIDGFNNQLSKLNNKYIPKSIYEELNNNYKDTYKYSKYIFISKKISEFNKDYKNLYNNIQLMNKKYIENELTINKDYFDNMFNYKLDIDQRKAIIIDDDYNLIIAGAGSGKTSTIIGKTKYLIEKKNISPEEIIVLSFNNNTVNNFKDRLYELGIKNIECLTFHKLGKNKILNYNEKIEDQLLDKIINNYLKEIILKDNKKLLSIVELFGLYIHIPSEKDFENLGEMYDFEYGYDLETIRNKYNNFINRDNDLYTLQQEKVRSYEELVIANYLFLNGINYEYEKKYDYDSSYNPDFYLTDYKIYLEHFGINEEGKCPQYSKKEEENYIKEINWKRDLHKQHNTKLLETYSYYFRRGIIIQKLEQILKNEGVEFKKVDYKKIYEAIIKNNQREEFKSFIELINKFIHMFKGNNYNANEFYNFYQDAIQNNNIRNQILLSIIYEIYTLYEEALLKNNQMDFDDLINKAATYVKDNGFNKNIKYIIVDEFQDTSNSRFSLLKSIIDKTKAKLVVVGDDWQSIYRFSGCDLDLFVNFNKYVKYPEKIFIRETHRNSQELINIAGNFIMKNAEGQISKELISTKYDEKPIHIYYYNYDIVKALNKAIEYLKSIGCKNIGILGRNKSDINWLNLLQNFQSNHPYIDLSKYYKDIDVKFYTIHKAKGLEFDGTIIINMKNFIAGFPNKMSDDPVLDYVTASTNDYLYEEERRLFYVALTRTKGKCCILVPIRNQSIFIDEILKDNPEKVEITMCEADPALHNYSCPICKKGKLIIRTNTKDKSKFISCTNYPKCNYKLKNLSILSQKMECPDCNHFLVKKQGIYGEFYGCTNYPKCKYTFNIEKKQKSNQDSF